MAVCMIMMMHDHDASYEERPLPNAFDGPATRDRLPFHDTKIVQINHVTLRVWPAEVFAKRVWVT